MKTIPCFLSLSFVLACSLLSGCKVEQSESKPAAEASSQQQTIANPEQFARKVISVLAVKDFEALAGLVHPEKGLSFSPYGYIDPEHIVIQATDLPKSWKENRVYSWGYYDGSGEPIELDFQSYFNQFIYSKKYVTAPDISIDKFTSRGNSRSNLQKVFPDARVVIFHFPGEHPKYGGLDWRSLQVVIESQEKTGWWLIGLLNDQWTI